MKRIIVCIAVLLFGLTAVFAQIDRLSIGIGGGLNGNTLGGKDSSDYDPNLGINFGFIGQVEMFDMFAIQPELKFTIKGYTRIYESENSWDNDMMFMGLYYYAEVPILFKLNMGSDSFKLQPFIGPSFAYLIKGEVLYGDKEDGAFNLDESHDITEYMETLDIGANIGVDAVLMKSVMLGLRYNHGLSKISKNNDNPRNRSLMFNVGLIFGL